MRYLVIVPGIGTQEWDSKRDAETSLATAHALFLADAWIALVPDEDDLDGSAGEGCGD